jgi:pyrimidine-specific ribonucleoside hydrolase
MRCYLDMDPGIDDAVALAVAVQQADVGGITTVAGNVAGDKTFRNAGRLLNVFGHPEVPVVPGAMHPLFQTPVIADHIHGESGLEGYPLTSESVPAASDLPAWQWLARQLEQETAPVEWIATGPLTNVARFLAAFDHRAYQRKVQAITVMGGSLSGGNVTPTAEFNFYADADAADFVLGSGWPVRMIGLDVTTRPGLPTSRLPDLSQMGSVGAVLAGLLAFYGEAIRRIGEAVDVLYLHDVVAVAAAKHPEKFTWKQTPLRVIREGELRGTVVEVQAKTSRPSVEVAVDVDGAWFLDWVWESLAAYR